MTAAQPVVPINGQALQTLAPSPRRERARLVDRAYLVNALNHLNFREHTVSLVFAGPAPDASVRIQAAPMPALSEYPVFLFSDALPEGLRPDRLTHLIIPDSNGEIHVEPRLHGATHRGVSLELPETGSRVQAQPRDIHTAEEIRVHFFLEGLACKGSLTAVDASRIRVRLSPLSASYFTGMSTAPPLRLTFLRNSTRLFALDALLLSQEKSKGDPTLHLTFIPLAPLPPLSEDPPVGEKEFQLVPAPDLVFSHPLTRSMQTVAIDNLSAVGLSCTIHEDAMPLLPGMTLEKAALTLSDLYTLPLTAKVTACTTSVNAQGESLAHCRLTFLTMPPESHRRLQFLIHKAENRNMRICPPVDDGDLWRFFFETGFIYKNKYRLFLGNKEAIKKTYHTLYSSPVALTRHVTYHEKGRTLGHMSILKYAERAWLIHHHAALKGGSVKVGLDVLSHLSHYFYDSFWLKSLGMDYLLCYFRPENAFPNFFFNGIAEKIANPAACSTDLFAYLTLRRESAPSLELPAGWSLGQANKEDLSALAESYAKTSGGLLVDALDLFERHAPADVLSAQYREAGLSKERRLWAIRHEGRCAAVVIVNTSDVALNMSDLTNCIKVCTTRPDLLTRSVLEQVLKYLAAPYATPRVPVLVHPFSWVEQSGFPYQKHYIFWVLNTRFSSYFMRHFYDILALSKQKR